MNSPDNPWTNELAARAHDGKGLSAPHLGIANTSKGPRRSIFVMDAQPIIQIREACNKMKMGNNTPFHPTDIMNILSEPNKRTLVLTHTVLRELMRSDNEKEKRSFGLSRDEKGDLGFHVSKDTLGYAGPRWLHDLLNANHEHLRCYDSVESMLEAGEFEQQRGGMVIVDDSSFSGHQPINHEGIYPAPKGEDGSPITDMGEKSIVQMAHMIDDYYDVSKDRPNGVGYAIIGMDKDLLKPIHDLSISRVNKRHPKTFNLKTLIGVLHENNLLPNTSVATLYEWLCRKNDPVRFDADGNRREITDEVIQTERHRFINPERGEKLTKFLNINDLGRKIDSCAR